MKLADKILDLRKKHGMSQEELAQKLNVSRQAISRWEGGSALPDASNVLQLSKLFGVTTDFLLNDEYESDGDVPVVKATRTTANAKIGEIIALSVAVIGVLGNFIIYILSRMIPVMIPMIEKTDTGEIWYTWDSEITDYSYKYFVQEHNLETLTIVFWGLVAVGIVALLYINKNKVMNLVETLKKKMKKTY